MSPILRLSPWLLIGSGCLLVGCGNDATTSPDPVPPAKGGTVPRPVAPSCKAQGGTAEVALPKVLYALEGDTGDGWLGSPAIVDLDGDGKNEIVAQHSGLAVWDHSGKLRFRVDSPAPDGRQWAGALVADFVGDSKLEVVVAAREQLTMLDAQGKTLPGWPVQVRDEIRSLAGGDLDGDGQLDIAVATTEHSVDILGAYHANGSSFPGFPPVQRNTIGCLAGENCWMAGAYDQNLAVGDLDADGHADLVAPMDNAYAGFYRGTGEAFDANPAFTKRPKTPGVRYLHELKLAEQGWADDEDTALQAHFTNTAPAIADVDGDGKYDVVMLGSVQNAAQTKRQLGVGLWVLHPDASRVRGWESPFHAPTYLAGLEDLEDNAVGATNQVSVVELDASRPGLELIFAGFDGKIHAVGADRQELWATPYTTEADVLTAGVALGDLSADGRVELVFATYSTRDDASHLFVLDAQGTELHRIALPGRGAMSVPTLGDLDGNGELEIAVSLRKVGWDNATPTVLVYKVAGAKIGCVPWPTGRANYLRNGWVPKAKP